jgi:hypothetical protein
MQIGVKTRAGADAVDAAGFDFREVRQELGREQVRATDQAAGVGEHLIVREVLEQEAERRQCNGDFRIRVHTVNVHPSFRSAGLRTSRAIDRAVANETVALVKRLGMRAPRCGNGVT